MMKVRKELAEQKALGVHMLYPEICTFPVNPIEIANKLGFVVRKDDSQGNIDGWYDADKKVIFLNTQQPLLRRRFTVCHEIGHALMLHGSSPRDNSKEYSKIKYDPKEVEANTFAAALLMPAPAVKNCVEKGMTFDGMVKFFGVSERAMAIRLKQLGIIRGNY